MLRAEKPGHFGSPRQFRLLLSFLFLLFLARVPGPAATAQAQNPERKDSGEYKISVRVGLVVLPVTVTGRQGHVVSELGEKNFRVLDDGQPQTITLFEREDVPAAIGLVVDDSGSMAPKQPEVAAAATAFARSSNPQDQMFIVYFNDMVFLGLPGGFPFTSDVDQLNRSFASITARGKTALYDGIAVALEHLKQSQLDRKALIVVSDGGDNASRHSLRQVLDMAESSNVVIYTIGLFDESEAGQNPGVLRRLAKVTGGKAYLPGAVSDVVNVSRQIAGDVRHQYTLGYVPATSSRGQKYHTIRVMVQAPGEGRLRIRTRTGYLAEPPEPEPPSQTVLRQSQPSVGPGGSR
jgi:Ca-activated chloride channel homolog